MPRKYNSGGAVPSESMQPIPRGDYPMEIVNVLHGKSKASGTEMVTVTAKILSGAPAGRTMKYYVMFHPQGHPSVGMTLHFLKTIGEPYEGEFEWDEVNWIGKKFTGTVEWENFNGSPTSKLKKLRPLEPYVEPPVEEVPF